MGINLNESEIQEVFGDVNPNRYETEAIARWGDTDAYKESARRTAGYSKTDWLAVQAEQAAVVEMFMSALAAGLPSDSPEAMAAAEAHRAGISNRFYACTYEMQVNLADMYLADVRFTEYYDRHMAGLAQYVSAAIHANAIANG